VPTAREHAPPPTAVTLLQTCIGTLPLLLHSPPFHIQSPAWLPPSRPSLAGSIRHSWLVKKTEAQQQLLRHSAAPALPPPSHGCPLPPAQDHLHCSYADAGLNWTVHVFLQWRFCNPEVSFIYSPDNPTNSTRMSLFFSIDPFLFKTNSYV
jgi:hypothetical protein